MTNRKIIASAKNKDAEKKVVIVSEEDIAYKIKPNEPVIAGSQDKQESPVLPVSSQTHDANVSQEEHDKNINPGQKNDADDFPAELDLSGRISHSTRTNGLKALPSGFDEKDGDWVCIKSANPFEILYLDYKLYKQIKPEVVKRNFDILNEFWHGKYMLLNTGGNRVAFKNKFGEGVIENSLSRLQNAYEKLKSPEGIKNYYTEINNKRLQAGRDSLKDSIEDMLIDGVVDRAEIELRLERGKRFDLEENETLEIINDAMESNKLKPYGKIQGKSLKEKLLSVVWMTEEKLREQQTKDEETKKRGREIFKGIIAHSTEEIGQILFDNEKLAKEYLKAGLIVNAIDYFSTPVAKEIKDIKDEKMDPHREYMHVVYRLNNNLAYKFGDGEFNDVASLSNSLFKNPKLGKEHLTKGYIEAWLVECHHEDYNKLIKIRDTAENAELAFLEMLYTFNPDIPYRFTNELLVKSPAELCKQIDLNASNWLAGKQQLFDGSINTWLSHAGHADIAEKWSATLDKFKDNMDAGLECFLHLLDKNLAEPVLALDVKSLTFPKVPAGSNFTKQFTIVNQTRGYVSGKISFSKKPEGVSISSNTFTLHNLDNASTYKVNFNINTEALSKGVNYATTIGITSPFTNLKLPVSFKIVFPTRSFLKILLSYVFMFASAGFAVRYLWKMLGFSDWIKVQYPYFLHQEDVFWQDQPQIFYFPLLLLMLLVLVILVFKKRK